MRSPPLSHCSWLEMLVGQTDIDTIIAEPLVKRHELPALVSHSLHVSCAALPLRLNCIIIILLFGIFFWRIQSTHLWILCLSRIITYYITQITWRQQSFNPCQDHCIPAVILLSGRGKREREVEKGGGTQDVFMECMFILGHHPWGSCWLFELLDIQNIHHRWHNGDLPGNLCVWVSTAKEEGEEVEKGVDLKKGVFLHRYQSIMIIIFEATW